GADIVIEGPGDFDHFGRALAVADLDRDGAADLIVGAPRADGQLNQRPDCGEVLVVFGASDLPARIDLSRPGASPRVTRLIGRAPGDALGTSIATADVTGDLLLDLILGAPLADGVAGAMGAQDSGEVFVVPGRAEWPATIDLAGPVPGVWLIPGADPGDQMG